MGSTKPVLYVIFDTCKLTDDVFSTTFCLLLNARPRMPVDADSEELQALTPDHLLLGKHAVCFPTITLE